MGGVTRVFGRAVRTRRDPMAQEGASAIRTHRWWIRRARSHGRSGLETPAAACLAWGVGAVGASQVDQPGRPGSASIEIMCRDIGWAVRSPVTPGTLRAMNGPIQIPEYRAS